MSETYNLDEASNLPDSQVELGLLRAQCKEQSEKIEILSQEVYSLRNRAQAAERVQEEYQAELEIQQQQVSGITASSATSLIKLKENHAKIIEDYESKLHCLEIELSDTKEETYILEEELAKAKKELENLQNTSPIATLKAELQELMEEHAANRLACAQHQDFNKVLLKEKSDLLMDLCSTREYLETTEEKLRICKADMMEQTETLEELRESLALVQNELALLKASPADTACRGNSLFAEVEDKRQAMLKKCSSLTKKYNEMRKDYSAKCNEISSLKLENLQLRRQWQDGVEERDNRDIWMKDNYEIRIKELAGMVEELKKTEKPVFVNGDSKILAYAEQEVDKTKRELRQLQEEMEWRSSERLNEAKALYNTRNELLYFKAEVMSLRAENLILRDKLSEANITDIPSPGKSMKKIMEVSLSPAKDEKKDDLCLNHSEIENVISLEDASRSPSHNPSSRPPVSSLLCSVPKPKRLIEHENREKLQLNDTKISEGEGESLQMVNDQSLISQSDPKPLTGEVAGLNSQDSPHLLYTNGVDETKLLQQEQQEGRVSEILECLALPINSNVSCPTDIESTDQNVDIVFQSKAIENGQAEGSNETLSDFQLQNLPGPSILAKLSCPSSLPVDQNAKTRKVRFVEDNLCEDQESSSSLKEPSHKKLLRIPQPRNYKTKIVASRETVYQ